METMGKDPPAATPPDGSGHESFARPASVADAVPRFIGTSLQSRPRNDYAAEAVLDKLNRGIVIFDHDGLVHFLNDAAMRFVREGRLIQLCDGRLLFAEQAAQSRFDTYLQRGIERADGGGEPSAVVMRIDPGAAQASFRVLLSPLRVPANPATGRREARHVLMIYEPNAGRRLPRRILTELYGLSEAEASLTLLLFEGESLEAAAQQLHVSVNTTKTQLHHVFVKCAVHSQGELLQLLSLGPRTL
jgi:DNA-binding CsgD family transcriptional regulator